MKRRLKRNLLACFAGILVVAWIFPLFWTFVSSFKPTSAFGRNEIVWVFKPSLENFRYVFAQFPFLYYLRNSTLVAIGSTLLSMVFGSLAGYSIARFRTGGKTLSLWILSTRMLPPAAIVLPFFMMFSKLGLIDNVIALIICYLVFNLSFTIWMTQTFFREIPLEIGEAAMIDGCTSLQVFTRITLPMSVPGLAATAIFCMIFSWNEFLFSLILTNSEAAQTLPASAGRFVTKYQVIWGPLFAETVLIIVPILIATMIMQKQIIRGISLGSLR